MSLISLIDSLIYPDVCPVCRQARPGQLLPPGLCRRCLSTLPLISEAERGFFWPSKEKQDVLGKERIFASMYYQEPLRQLLIRFKFKNQPELVKILAPFMYRVLRRSGLPCDAVVAIPLHQTRQRERGYNQACLLAAEIARLGGYKPCLALLSRQKETIRQSGINDKAARKANLQKAFLVDHLVWQQLTAQTGFRPTIWLIDDIVSTGSTLEAAADSLRILGCQVQALAAAVNLEGFSLKRENYESRHAFF